MKKILFHLFGTSLCLASSLIPAAEPGKTTYRVRLTVTSHLPFPNVPMDPPIDFAAIIKQADLPGVLDPNSIIVVDMKTGKPVPHAMTEDFAYSDKGRVEWVIQDPTHKQYEIRFRTAEKRPALMPAEYTPLIGVGDLLRYNAGAPRPITTIYLSRLIDLNGDGKRDLVGCWNYAYRPGLPWDGVVCFPRVGSTDRFEFGDLTHLRYVDESGSDNIKYFSHIYMHADLADLNGDGLIDLVYYPRSSKHIYFYLNSGRSDASKMPIFIASGSISCQTANWGPCRAIDLNRDGALDLVINGTYLKNTNPKGWPIAPAKAVTLDVGLCPCFYDVDNDGALDAVCLVDGTGDDPRDRRVAWRRNLGSDPPKFDTAKILEDIDCWWCSYLAAVNDGQRRGLLVLHDVWQTVSFYEQINNSGGKPRFRRFGRALSKSAVISLSDQAWPCICDWDGDGDWDLLVGGGYGWPRIVINNGTNEMPAFAEPQLILSEGKPIRILRNEVLGGNHWHNMGYPYPVYDDWDADGLPDLILPNETNRIFWYKNIGTRQQPKFSKRQQVICDGYPDSPEERSESAKEASGKNCYPPEKDQPFFWRTAAGFADWTNDGLMDLITHDGYTRRLTLFAQYRDTQGKLRLAKDRLLKLADGRPIDDSIVSRSAHWTESFRCVDWDGDGLLDIVYSCAGTERSQGSIYLLRNCGTKTNPKFENPRTLRCFGNPIWVTRHGPHPWIGDMNGDGKPDILACVEWSVYPFYTHAAVEMKQRPNYVLTTVEER